MRDRPSLSRAEVARLRDLLHSINDELSVAILELELLLEDGSNDEVVRRAVGASLSACRRAAVLQREVWAGLDGRASQA